MSSEENFETLGPTQKSKCTEDLSMKTGNTEP